MQLLHHVLLKYLTPVKNQKNTIKYIAITRYSELKVVPQRNI